MSEPDQRKMRLLDSSREAKLLGTTGAKNMNFPPCSLDHREDL